MAGDTCTTSRTCPRCGVIVPLQKAGVAVGIRPCPNCGRPLAVRSAIEGENESVAAVRQQIQTSLATELERAQFDPDGGAAPESTNASLSERRPRKSLWRRLASVAVIVAVVSLVWSAIIWQTSQIDRTYRNNLTRIAAAIRRYADDHAGLLPTSGYLPDGSVGFSWRVQLLPYFNDPELTRLYKRVRLEEPWDSLHNFRIAQEMPAIYRTKLRIEPHHTTLHVFTGESTPFGSDSAVDLANISEPPAEIIAVVVGDENHAECWTKPGGIPLPTRFQYPFGQESSGYDLFVMLDGQVKAITGRTDNAVIRSLAMVNDGVKKPSRLPTGSTPKSPAVAPISPAGPRTTPATSPPAPPAAAPPGSP